MYNKIVASVYGSGGWNRYHIDGSGAVNLSAMHAEDDVIIKAQELGFQVV